MARFLLDENVPVAVGVFLRGMNFDVIHVRECGLLGASDDQILELTRQEESLESASIHRCLPTSRRLLTVS